MALCHPQSDIIDTEDGFVATHPTLPTEDRSHQPLSSFPLVLTTSPVEYSGLAPGPLRFESFHGDPRDEKLIARQISRADAILVDHDVTIGETALAAARRLRVIGRLGVGVDNIDLAAAKRRSISVVHARGANASSVAEYCLGQIIGVTRKLAEAAEAGLRGQAADERLVGRELSELSIGLVGFGDVARRLTDLIEPTGARLLVHTRDSQAAAARGLETVPDLWSLARACDVVSLHLPAAHETRHLIDERFFSTARHGMVLLNTGRGSLVDESALLDALRSGRVSAAVLDVRSAGPSRRDELTADPRVVTTPHVAAMTPAARRRVVELVIADVAEVLAGRTPRFPV